MLQESTGPIVPVIPKDKHLGILQNVDVGYDSEIGAVTMYGRLFYDDGKSVHVNIHRDTAFAMMEQLQISSRSVHRER